MLITVLILITFMVIGTLAFVYGRNENNSYELLAKISGTVALIVCAIILVVLIIINLSLIGDKHRADLYNKVYGTEYTAEDFFYGFDIIRKADAERNNQ